MPSRPVDTNVYPYGPFRLTAASPMAIEKVRRFTEEVLKLPQLPFVTEHMLHGGMYARTVRLPPDIACAAVLMKVPTVLIFQGDAKVYSDDQVIEVSGYNVIPGSNGRKIAFYTLGDVSMTMVFPTTAKTVDEAQREFTDEHAMLIPLSEADRHRIVITGE